jgi:hypothetical protein
MGACPPTPSTRTRSGTQRLIDRRQYVLCSRWQDVQPRALEQNAFLKTHSWEEYAAWHFGLTEVARPRSEGTLRICLRRLPSSAPDGADRLPLPCRGVALAGEREHAGRIVMPIETPYSVK